MKRVTVHRSQKTAVGVDKVVVPHDGGTFLGRQNKICQVTIDAQVELVRGSVGAFQLLRKQLTNDNSGYYNSFSSAYRIANVA